MGFFTGLLACCAVAGSNVYCYSAVRDGTAQVLLGSLHAGFMMDVTWLTKSHDCLQHADCGWCWGLYQDRPKEATVSRREGVLRGGSPSALFCMCFAQLHRQNHRLPPPWFSRQLTTIAIATMKQPHMACDNGSCTSLTWQLIWLANFASQINASGASMWSKD